MKKKILPIDDLENIEKLVNGRSAGIITNQSCVNSCNIFILPEMIKRFNIKTVFAPEHGLSGSLPGGVTVKTYFDKDLGVQVNSLYKDGEYYIEKEELEDIEVIIYHVQDLGLRFYTYISTLFYFMETIHKLKSEIELIILDRPNPLGRAVEGPMLNKTFSSFVSKVPVPVRYGLTVGELAGYIKKKMGFNVNLKIVKIKDYHPKEFYGWIDEIEWNPPSSAIKNIETAFLYSGICLFEGTDISEGRGTSSPFQMIGKPKMKTDQVINFIRDSKMPVQVMPVSFTPNFSKYKGILCNGLKFRLRSYENFYGVLFAGYLLHFCNPEYTDFFDRLAGTDKMRKAIETNYFDKALPMLILGEVEKYKEDIKEFYLYE